MTTFLIYLLKMIVCSGFLFSFYRIVLYNRSCHQWNRFYLLGAVVASMLLPLITITINTPVVQSDRQIIRLLNVVGADKDFLHEDPGTPGTAVDYGQVILMLYMLVSSIIFCFLLHSLYRLFKLTRTQRKQKLGSIMIIQTEEKDAPFTFFRNIFWNAEIDLASPAGKRILDHEITHARELHSADRLLMNLTTVFFWSNPFFWLIRKEMTCIHEFIADQNTIMEDDLKAFSQMIVTAAFPGQVFRFTSNFSYPSLKRRIHMLTKSTDQKINYFSRLLFLPVFFVIVAAFTIRIIPVNNTAGSENSLAAEKAFTIVIDAGHGGTEQPGAISTGGKEEKHLNLLIAKKIAASNTNKNLRIILTRDDDRNKSLKERVDLAVKNEADAFISIHMASNEPSMTGVDLIVSKKSSGYSERSQLLGSIIAREISQIYSVTPEIKTGPADKGIWVLDAPEITYPALLIECGNLNNSKDLAFIEDPANQQKIADQILKGIMLFSGSK